MDFGRLGPSDPGGSSRRSTAPLTPSTTSNSSPKNNKKLIMLSILAAALIIASAISAALITVVRSRASSNNSNLLHSKPTQAISRTCSKTRYPSLCINSLLDFPGSTSASEQELVHISFNMTHRHISKALFASSGLSYTVANPRVRAAYEDCLELMDESMDAIRSSMDSLMTTSSTLSNDDGESRQFSNVGGSTEDVMTWLSAALTNQDTCLEGFEDTSGTVKDQMVGNLKDLSELVSNSLAIFSASGDNDFTGVPIQNKRRLMGMSDISREFPKWLKKRDRRLLSLPVSAIQADIIVSKSGGNGTVKTITEAIKKAPEHSLRRFIIYVRAGR